MIINIFTGPFGGKTTLLKLAQSQGVRVREREAALEKEFGIDGPVKGGWRPESPHHQAWLYANEAERRITLNLASPGSPPTLYLSWDPVLSEMSGSASQQARVQCFFLYPGYEELRKRAAEYARKAPANGKDAVSRLEAALHWWIKAGERGYFQRFECLPDGTRALAMLLKRFPALMEGYRP